MPVRSRQRTAQANKEGATGDRGSQRTRGMGRGASRQHGASRGRDVGCHSNHNTLPTQTRRASRKALPNDKDPHGWASPWTDPPAMRSPHAPVGCGQSSWPPPRAHTQQPRTRTNGLCAIPLVLLGAPQHVLATGLPRRDRRAQGVHLHLLRGQTSRPHSTQKTPAHGGVVAPAAHRRTRGSETTGTRPPHHHSQVASHVTDTRSSSW